MANRREDTNDFAAILRGTALDDEGGPRWANPLGDTNPYE
jgi:hypothetical protein